MRNIVLLIFLLIIAIVGCDNNSPSESRFTPPKNKMITKEMATSYAIVSVALTKAVEEEAAIIEDFREKCNISLDMNELNDRKFKEENPEVMAEWERIQKDWQERQASVYGRYGMSEKEWDWIAGSLIMPRNRPMQEFIRKEIERIEREEFQIQTQATDST